MAILRLGLLRKFIVFFLICIIISSWFIGIVYAVDSDGDGISDDDEAKYNMFPDDADSDDDGVFDGDEIDWNNDTDGDGDINTLDPDSDDDGILDGTEMGVTNATLHKDTDVFAGNFEPDRDLGDNVTSMVNNDTDGDHIPDGVEDTDKNGRFDPKRGETDPLVPDFDKDDIPGEEPKVSFKYNEVTFEANETIVFDNALFSVSDSEEDLEAGLNYTWIWDDGDMDKELVHNPNDYNISHSYSIPGNYSILLNVKDQRREENSSSMKINITVQKTPIEPPDGKDEPTDGNDTTEKEKSDDKTVTYALISIPIIIVIIFIIFMLIGMAYFIRGQKRYY